MNKTKTDICNLALSFLGEKPINSIDDNSSALASICKTHFDIVFRSVIEGGEWPFVTTEQRLERVAYPRYSAEQRYVYKIPEKCGLIVQIGPKFERKYADGTSDWDIRYIPDLGDNFIISNYKERVYCEYIRAEENFSLYSAKFIRYLAAELAASMCLDVTKNEQRAQYMIQYASLMKQDALTSALNQEKQDKMHWVDSFTASRG